MKLGNMDNLNLPPFYVGQKVVYINNVSLPTNSIHTVLNIVKSSCCGMWGIQIECSRLLLAPQKRCCQCGLHSSFTGERQYYAAISFKTLEEMKFPSLKMKEVVKKESQLISMN